MKVIKTFKILKSQKTGRQRTGISDIISPRLIKNDYILHFSFNISGQN